jgi:hypothetical protein
MWTGSMLAGQSGWASYGGSGDQWPGAMATIDTAPDKGDRKTYRLPLSEALPPGQYKVLIKEFYGGKVEATLGDASKTIEYKRRTWEPIELKTTQPAKELALTFFPTINEPSQNYILQGVYLTSNPAETVNADNLVLVEKKPASGASTPSAPVASTPDVVQPPNLIENASFELGKEHNWGRLLGMGSLLTAENFDSSIEAVDGRTSLKSPLLQMNSAGRYETVIETKFIKLVPNRTYSLSAYVGSNLPMQVTLALTAHPDDANSTDDGPSPLLKAFQIAGDEWQRITVTGNVPASPGNIYTVRLHLRSAQPNTCWIDAVQLEEGRPKQFKTRQPVEIGLESGVPGNIYFKNEPASCRVLIYNPERRRESINLTCSMSDLYGNVVWQRKEKVDLQGETAPSASLQLPTQRNGLFRLRVETDQSFAIAKELTLSVLPRPQHLDEVFTEGTLGADSNTGLLEAGQILKRAHFSWIRDQFAVRWPNVEREQGKYVFDDKNVDAARAAKLAVMLQPMDLDWARPEWLKPFREGVTQADGTAIWPEERRREYLKYWSDYVQTVAAHYKGRVRYWEIENEPNYVMKPEQYRDLLQVAYQHLKAADPDNTVIGLSTYYVNWGEQVLKDGGAQFCDEISGHYYDNTVTAHERWADMARRYNKTSWNTETGLTEPSFLTSFPTLESAQGDADYWEKRTKTNLFENEENSIKNYLISMGFGEFKHYIYYIARIVNNGPSQITKRGGGGKELFEYNGSQRPNCFLLSIGASFLDGAKLYRQWRGDSRVYCFVFEKGSGSVGFVWSQSGAQLQAVVQASPQQFTFYDMMGNALPAEAQGKTVAAEIGRMPLYFSSPLSAAALMDKLNTMTLSQPIETIAKIASEKGNPVLRVVLRNEESQATDIDLQIGGWLGGLLTAKQSAPVTQVKPGETKIADFPVVLPRAPMDLVMQIQAADQVLTHRSQVALLGAAPAHTITLDGDLADWGEGETAYIDQSHTRAGHGNIFGENDFRGMARARYDAQNLYLSLEAVDDIFRPQATGENEDTGDRVRFLLSTKFWQHPLASRPGIGDFSVTARALEGGRVQAQLSSSEGESKAIPAALQTHAGGWTVELAVPWALLGVTPEDEIIFGFQVEAYDSDAVGGGADTEFVWTGSANTRDDPRDWGQMWLVH